MLFIAAQYKTARGLNKVKIFQLFQIYYMRHAVAAYGLRLPHAAEEWTRLNSLNKIIVGSGHMHITNSIIYAGFFCFRDQQKVSSVFWRDKIFQSGKAQKFWYILKNLKYYWSNFGKMQIFEKILFCSRDLWQIRFFYDKRINSEKPPNTREIFNF